MEDLAGSPLNEQQRQQLFLKLRDGGLGLTSAADTAPLGFLASWALVLPEVAGAVGFVSWSTFAERCSSVFEDIQRAERDMAQRGDGELAAHDWVAGYSTSKSGLQGEWARQLKSLRREKLLQQLSRDDQVDFRSCGGPGAGAFLEQPVCREDETPVRMPCSHFRLSLRDRLRLDVCPEGARCQRRNADGVVCGQILDPRGNHAKLCPYGRAKIARHDSLRDFAAGYHQRTTGLVTHTEQRVVAWDRINPRTGQLEEARLDFATRDALTGRSVFADVTVTCAYSGYEPCQRARARKDGLAAVNAVAKKRDRYPPSGGELIPLAWEDGGRPAEETVTYVRSWGHGFPPGERTMVIRYAWQQLSCLLQVGNAEMIMSAVGF